jgi:hypothetical protein
LRGEGVTGVQELQNGGTSSLLGSEVFSSIFARWLPRSYRSCRSSGVAEMGNELLAGNEVFSLIFAEWGKELLELQNRG